MCYGLNGVEINMFYSKYFCEFKLNCYLLLSTVTFYYTQVDNSSVLNKNKKNHQNILIKKIT